MTDDGVRLLVIKKNVELAGKDSLNLHTTYGLVSFVLIRVSVGASAVNRTQKIQIYTDKF